MSTTNMSQEDWEAGAEDRANALLDECKLELEALKVELATLRATAQRRLELLKTNEWRGHQGRCCPECNSPRWVGHKAGCHLAAELKGAK